MECFLHSSVTSPSDVQTHFTLQNETSTSTPVQTNR